MTEQRTVPNVFIHGKHIGGADATMKLHTDGKLMELIMPPSENYTYDLIVIGGGSGGLACSKVLSTGYQHCYEMLTLTHKLHTEDLIIMYILAIDCTFFQFLSFYKLEARD